MKRAGFVSQIVALMIGGAVLQGASVAILDSSINTRAFFAAHYPNCNPSSNPPSRYLGADEYMRYFVGWTYVLSHPGSGPAIPYDIIHDADVTDQTLSKYKLLILSNTANLSEDEQRTIRAWVIRGGRLLATFGSGYKDTVSDPREIDDIKAAEGGTLGLHQMWHDPATKVFGSNPLNDGAGTDILITRYEGPTASLQGQLTNNLLPYGAESNILVHRPEDFHDTLGLVVLKNATLAHPTPAILVTQQAHGLVVYFAFAPEYLVSKEFNPAPLPFCFDPQNWTGRSAKGRILMEGAVRYLLAN